MRARGRNYARGCASDCPSLTLACRYLRTPLACAQGLLAYENMNVCVPVLTHVRTYVRTYACTRSCHLHPGRRVGLSLHGLAGILAASGLAGKHHGVAAIEPRDWEILVLNRCSCAIKGIRLVPQRHFYALTTRICQARLEAF